MIIDVFEYYYFNMQILKNPYKNKKIQKMIDKRA